MYDLIDETFGFKRPRPLYDWLYRQNPSGAARCWIVVEKSSGKLVHTSADWPWPVARGTEGLVGAQRGDWAVAPGWQRQGINQLRMRVKKSHPWHEQIVTFSWPNENARGSSQKHGHVRHTIGPARRQVVLLRIGRDLAERGWPQPLATIAAGAGDAVLKGWQRIRLGGQVPSTIEEVRRFDSGFDAVTERCMMWREFWCPHDASFLNWRYLEHPTRSYGAFALLTDDGMAGYYVVKIDGERAWLMDFVAPQRPSGIARALLGHTIGVAREAGCRRLDFFATPGWHHRWLFDTAGFLDRPSGLFINVTGPYDPDVFRFENWQLIPGDADFL